MTLRKQTFSGVRWTTFSSLGRAVLQFVQIAILARLLAPSDFGLIAVVVSIMAFLQIFADAGISNAIIHYQDIAKEQLSSLYWLNVSVSAILALTLVASSHWVAYWYQQPALQYLLMLAAVTLVVGALGQQIRVLAQKNLRFADLAKVELVAALFGFLVAVPLAWMGAGVYALIAGSLTTAAVGCLLVWLRLSDGWRPQARLRLAEIRQFIKFGAYMVGNNLANTLISQIDILLGGRLLGVQSIGLYSVPKDLSLRIGNIINPIITQVGLPVMAKAQGDEALLKKVYLQTMRMTASVNFPIYMALGLFAPEIVHLLLGQQWHDAIPLLQIFAIWALLRSTGNPVGSLLMARGRADLSFKWNMVWLLIMAPAIWIGSQFGVSGMAIAMTVLGVLAYWPNWYFLVRPLCGAKLGEYSAQMAVPLGLSIFAGLAGYLSSYLLEGDLLRLEIGVLLGSSVYIGLSWLFNRVWVEAMMGLLAGRFVGKRLS
jgi:O-antigen/teichoic acid export membrane protein